MLLVLAKMEKEKLELIFQHKNHLYFSIFLQNLLYFCPTVNLQKLNIQLFFFFFFPVIQYPPPN